MSEVIDNRAQRVRTLKDVIKRLHAGESPEAVRGQLATLVRETDYSEIVAMEQQLMEEGMPVEEITSMCDLHSQLTREVLVQPPPRPVAPGHPVDTMRQENGALRGVLLRMQEAMAGVRRMPDEAVADEALLPWRVALNELMDIEKHYQRKENAFFPALERHGITGPSKVMWAKDDEIRAMLKELQVALRQSGIGAGEWKAVADFIGRPLVDGVEEMIYKEENILLPMCLSTFTEEDWATIWASSPRYGWCLVEPAKGYKPPDAILATAGRLTGGGAVELGTGNLSLDQLTAIFRTLPEDITFVDADDRVAFFSEGPDRVFARSRAILGRKVQHCHPPRSVDTVDRILADFKEGRQSVAAFWINFHGKFVHIQYFAVRGESGEYLGTLEVTQDGTNLRSLQGERRLLEYAQ